MEKEATKFFEMLLNNSADILRELKMQVYKLLDLDGKIILPNKIDNERLLEQIKTSIETFNFNLQEEQFLSLIQRIIKEELEKITTSRNYELFGNNLIERLESLREFDISLENDFKDLSSRIASEFHTQEEYYNYFIARQENIVNMLKSYNKSVVSALVNLTPRLIEELKFENEKRTIYTAPEYARKSDEALAVSSDLKKTTEQALLEKTIDICQRRKKELDDMFRNPNYSSDKSVIAKTSRQLANLIEELSKGTYNEQLSDISDIAIESFISHKIPALEEIKKLESSMNKILSSNNSQQLNGVSVKQETKVEQSKEDEEYLKRKQQIMDNFINSTVMDFANKIYRTYPYSLKDADVSSYKEHFKSIYHIPRYPISDEEWDMIIEQINKKLFKIVNMLIKEDQLNRLGTMTQKAEEVETTGSLQNVDSISNTKPTQISQTNNSSIEGEVNDDLSMMVADEVKWNIIFDMYEKYNNGFPFVPITPDDLKSRYNINSNISQILALEINTIVKNHINEKEKSKTNYQPYILDGIGEENKGIHR